MAFPSRLEPATPGTTSRCYLLLHQPLAGERLAGMRLEGALEGEGFVFVGERNSGFDSPWVELAGVGGEAGSVLRQAGF